MLFRVIFIRLTLLQIILLNTQQYNNLQIKNLEMATYVSDSSINKSEAYWLNKEKRKLYKTNTKHKHLIFNILSHFSFSSTADNY